MAPKHGKKRSLPWPTTPVVDLTGDAQSSRAPPSTAPSFNKSRKTAANPSARAGSTHRASGYNRSHSYNGTNSSYSPAGSQGAAQRRSTTYQRTNSIGRTESKQEAYNRRNEHLFPTGSHSNANASFSSAYRPPQSSSTVPFSSSAAAGRSFPSFGSQNSAITVADEVFDDEFFESDWSDGDEMDVNATQYSNMAQMCRYGTVQSKSRTSVHQGSSY